jgi:hypothetical protein
MNFESMQRAGSHSTSRAPTHRIGSSAGWQAPRSIGRATSPSAIHSAAHLITRDSVLLRGSWTIHQGCSVDGEAAQSNTLRWEDYTQTAMDPVDDCTMWYVGDYLKKNATLYSTRIASFRLPGCSAR